MLFRNTVAQTVALITGYIFSFILAPIMIARLGLAEFGVWAVTGAFTQYAAIMDLGITRSIGRFVAVFDAKGDRRSIERVWTLGLIAVTVVGLLALAIVVLAAAPIAHALGDVLAPGEMRVVLMSSVGIFFLHAYRNVCNAVPQGHQRFVETNIAIVAGNVVNFAFSLAALFGWGDLVVYALANLAAEAVGLGFTLIALRTTTPWVRPRLPDVPLVRQVLGFSVKAQLAWVAELANVQADKVIIALFIDIRAAGAYEVANRVVSAVKALAVMSVSAMVPTATHAVTTHGRKMVRGFYGHYTKRAVAVSFPLLLLASAAAPAALVGWLGDVPEYATVVFISLTLANCVNLSTGVAYALSLGEGRAGLIALSAFITAGIDIVATVALAPVFGIWGVLAGTVIGIVGGSAAYLYLFHRDHGLPAIDYARAVSGPAVVAVLAAAPVVLVQLLVFGVPDARPAATVATVAYAVMFVGIYWPVASRLGLLPEKLQLGRLRTAVGRRLPSRLRAA